MHNDFEKRRAKMRQKRDHFEGFFWVVFAVSAIASLATTAVIIWAIIKIVSHFTG